MLIRSLLVVLLLAVLPAARPATTRTPDPVRSPPGANDWSCRPDKAHPSPVVLVHGTLGNAYDDWFALSPRLAEAGYCVYALDYGDTGHYPLNGTAALERSARELAAFVGRVLEATGARRTSIVGYSQGGTLPRYYLRFLGGSDKVEHVVGLAPTGHGSTSPLWHALPRLLPYCAACGQQNAGSPLLAELNAGGDVVAGVNYTVIASMTDEFITPWRRQFLEGPGVVNVTLQSLCPADLSEHVTVPVSPVVARAVLDALAGLRPRAGCAGLGTPAHLWAVARRVGTVGVIALASVRQLLP